MGLLKEAGDSFLKYGEKLVNKTEEFTKIAKLNLDLKKCVNEITEIKTEIGIYVLKQIKEGKSTIDLKDSKIKALAEKIDEIKKTIGAKKQEIKDLKKETEPEKHTQTKSEKPSSEKSDSENSDENITENKNTE